MLPGVHLGRHFSTVKASWLHRYFLLAGSDKRNRLEIGEAEVKIEPMTGASKQEAGKLGVGKLGHQGAVAKGGPAR
jgi:hypothetical protein